jgi:hypothetical protein
MGLLDEAKKEFEKALLGFRTAMASGIVNDEMIKRVEEIEGKAGQQANKTAIQQAGRPAGPQTDGKNKKEERIKKEKQIAGGKKKISFV